MGACFHTGRNNPVRRENTGKGGEERINAKIRPLVGERAGVTV